MDNPGLQPPITPPPPIPPPPVTPTPEPVKEEPIIQPPVNQTAKKVKKFAPKLMVGTLMVALLVGGLVLGKNLLQEKQRPVEKLAGGGCVPGCYGAASGHDGNYACKLSGMLCKRAYNPESDCTGATVSCSEPFYSVMCVCPEPPPPPKLSCVDLTKDKTAPSLGDQVTFTCEASFSAVQPVAFFRAKVGVDDWWTSPAQAINPSTNQALFDFDIDKTGDWIVQCRVCTTAAAKKCTEWGQAN